MIRRREMRPEKLINAKRMRLAPTPAEAALWARLRKRGIGFRVRRQAPMWGYIADFYIAQADLIIEVDGGYHEYQTDAVRDARLAAKGIKTLRFDNDEVLQEMDRVLAEISNAAKNQRTAKGFTRGQ